MRREQPDQGRRYLLEQSLDIVECLSEQQMRWEDNANALAGLNVRISHRPEDSFIWHSPFTVDKHT